MKVKIEFTKDWLTFKKGDTVERSKDIANLHIKQLKNAKLYVKSVKKATKKKA
ncbi:MAG: hypothetical protein ACPGRW_06170 [Flavobacteriaceae bacterium]